MNPMINKNIDGKNIEIANDIDTWDACGKKCDENAACKYFTWVDVTYNGVHGTGIRKRCHLKNVKDGISDQAGLISGSKGCRQGN